MSGTQVLGCSYFVWFKFDVSQGEMQKELSPMANPKTPMELGGILQHYPFPPQCYGGAKDEGVQSAGQISLVKASHLASGVSAASCIHRHRWS